MYGLDGLRGLGAVMGVLFHLSENNLLPHYSFLKNSHLFVLVFFVISGVVISSSSSHTPNFSFAKFILRRFARIWPVHAVILFAMMSFHIFLWGKSGLEAREYFIGDHALNSFFLSLLLIQSMGVYDAVVWNGPSWSISVEFYTYVLFALFITFFQKYFRILSISMWIASVVLVYSYGGLSNLPYTLIFFYCTLGFFSGVLLFDFSPQDRAPGSEAFINTRQLAAFAILLICLQFYHLSPIIIAPFLFATTAIIADISSNSGILSAIFSARPFYFLGRISYSLYIAHIPLLNIFTRTMEFLRSGENYYAQILDIIFLPAYFSFLILISWTIYNLIEIPAQNKLVRASDNFSIRKNS